MLDFFHYLLNDIHWFSVGFSLITLGVIFRLLSKSSSAMFILDIQEYVYKNQKTKPGIESAKKVSDLKKITRKRGAIYGLIFIVLGIFCMLISFI